MDQKHQASQESIHHFQFSGSGSEYFGIWFVNNIFTWLTLGIYSAWAKVRRIQYFFGNTRLAGGSFQFTANPLVILRNRVIAAALLILYLTVDALDTLLANIVLATFIGAYFIFAPVLTVFVMSFRTRYSEWRGISFRFNKDIKGAYRVYLAPLSILGMAVLCLVLPVHGAEVEEFFGYETPAYIAPESYDPKPVPEQENEFVNSSQENGTGSGEEESYVNPYLFIPSGIFGILFLCLFPYFDFINARFMARNVQFGKARFHFIARLKDYYIVYSIWLTGAIILAAFWLLEITNETFSNTKLLWLLVIASIFFIPLTRAFFKSQRYNLLLNNVLIDKKHRLRANTSFWGMLALMVTNSIVVLITIGLMNPWAQVRTARYLLNHTSLEIDGNLDDIVAQQASAAHALGEEVADIFDIDII